MRKINPVAHCNYCDVVEDSCTRILSWCIDSPTQKHDFNKCEPKLTHVKPCLNLNNGNDSCSCGCDAYGNWCVVEEQMYELSTSSQKYSGMMNRNFMEEKLKKQINIETGSSTAKLSIPHISINEVNVVVTTGTAITDNTNYPSMIFTTPQIQQLKKLWDTSSDVVPTKGNQRIKEPTIQINLDAIVSWMKNEASDEERQKLYEMLYNSGCRIFK